jgi:PiT family inorganic phosphate transporter
MAVLFAEQLLHNFSGKGLVGDGLTTDETYISAVALGAGFTVLLASIIGMPISTTHSLVGALVGAGLAGDSVVNLEKLATTFILP